MNDNVKLFDFNGKLVDNFDEEIEKILISVHGENYYDTDEELTNTNLIPLNEEFVNSNKLEKSAKKIDDMVDDDAISIKIVKKKNGKITFKDFIPVLFFIIIAALIIAAGYYFLSSADILSLLGLK